MVCHPPLALIVKALCSSQIEGDKCDVKTLAKAFDKPLRNPRSAIVREIRSVRITSVSQI